MAKGKKQRREAAAPRRAAASERRRSTSSGSTFSFGSNELIYGKNNYIIIGVGLFLICLGLVLMQGGAMPSPDVWDESLIYSTRRITVAPILMLLGFGVVGYGIFATNENTEEADEA